MGIVVIVLLLKNINKTIKELEKVDEILLTFRLFIIRLFFRLLTTQ